METIFDHNVTEAEIKACGFLDDWQRIRHGSHIPEDLTKESYIANVKEDDAIFDIALLFRERKLSAQKYWDKIPERASEYLRGFDNIIIASE